MCFYYEINKQDKSILCFDISAMTMGVKMIDKYNIFVVYVISSFKYFLFDI